MPALRTNGPQGPTTPGYLAMPAQAGRFPGIVVIQEWWGLVPHIKDVTERFARGGFVALAPDLYHGQAADEPDEARKLAMALDRERAVQEILAASRFLRSLDEVTPKKIGVVGWCMGGGLALSPPSSTTPARRSITRRLPRMPGNARWTGSKNIYGKGTVSSQLNLIQI